MSVSHSMTRFGLLFLLSLVFFGALAGLCFAYSHAALARTVLLCGHAFLMGLLLGRGSA